MEDLRQRTVLFKPTSVGNKAFGKNTFPLFSSLLREFKPVYRDSRFQRITWLGVLNLCSYLLLLHWCNLTRSLGLSTFAHIVLFDFLCLCICALSIWVEQKKPSPKYTFGYERVEVLAVFMSTSFSIIASLLMVKKSMGRWFHQNHIYHTGHLFPGVLIAFVTHMVITYCMKNKGLNLVICASNPNWIQTQVSAANKSLSNIVPGSNGNSSRINPFTLLGFVAGGALIVAVFLIDVFNYYSADVFAAIFVSLVTFMTMFPLSVYGGNILLQGTPPHITDLLDKCLREASTLDGVLEFRNEHFWLLGFDKIVGTMHVRVGRDANEQVVLSHLLGKLSSLVTDLTIQVFKDEWTWSSSTRQILNDPYLKLSSDKEVYSIPSTISIINSPNSMATSHSPSAKSQSVQSSSPSLKAQETKPLFATVPLPPSLASSQSPKSHIELNMNPSTVPKYPQYSPSTAMYSLQSTTSSNKYNRELSINPLLYANPDYAKSNRS